MPADGITRRDFINGMLVAAGGAVAGGLGPRGAEACVDIGKNVCDGPIGLDPRALRGGNLPGAFVNASFGGNAGRDDLAPIPVGSPPANPVGAARA